jgi:hypothetical protein
MYREITISHWTASIAFLARELWKLIFPQFRFCQNGWDEAANASLAFHT